MKLPHGPAEWTGAVAFVVALFVSIGWAVAMVAAAIDDDVSAQGVQLLAGLGGVLSGAVAAYLGAGTLLLAQRRRERDDEKE